MSHPGPFDEQLIRQRYARLRLSGPEAMPAFLHEHAAAEIAARIAARESRFGEAMICTLAPSSLARDIKASGRAENIRRAAPFARPRGGEFDCVLDLQQPELAPRSLDLFVSIFDLALVNDLPGALSAIRRALRPGGLFLAALPAGETLRELRAAWALADRQMDGEPALRVAPFCELRQLGGLLQLAGFARPVADAGTLTLRYANAHALMEEIKALGWANPLRARPRAPAGRARLTRAIAHYETAFRDNDGRVRATFQIAWLTAWSPDESQGLTPGPGTACALPASTAGDDGKG